MTGVDNMTEVTSRSGQLLGLQAYPAETKTTVKGKGKAVLLQAWSDPEGSRKSRFPDFVTLYEGKKSQSSPVTGLE